jgi:hypothetical protein
MRWLKLILLAGAPGLGAGLVSAQEAAAPVAQPSHAVYLEAGGLPAFEGGPYSVNVEQRLILGTRLRVGAYYGPLDGQMALKLPILLNYVSRGSQHGFELGGGVRWDVAGADDPDVRLAAIVGYRYQELPGVSLVRAGLSFDLRDLSGGSDAWKLAPWPYVSIGFGF